MFNLIIVVILATASALLASIGVIFKVPEMVVISVVGGAISFVWMVASIIGTFVQYSSQQERLEDLHGSLNNLAQYKKMKDELLGELKNYLGSVYPEQEKEIFKSILDVKSDINLVLSYPEIQSSHVLKELATRIKELYSNLYNLQRSIEKECSEIRYHNISKWEYFMPVIPPVLSTIIYSTPVSNI